MSIYQIAFLAITYLIAAIPFGLVISKLFAQKDIREHGSKNIGATNVTRVLGKKLGFITLILDGLKGAVMVLLAKFFFEYSSSNLFLVMVAAFAVIGHVYPIYLKFNGGKGVATAIATLFALSPVIGSLVCLYWLIIFFFFRIVSLASIISVISSVALSAMLHFESSLILFCAFLSLVIVVRHKENISRLLAGEENCFKK